MRIVPPAKNNRLRIADGKAWLNYDECGTSPRHDIALYPYHWGSDIPVGTVVATEDPKNWEVEVFAEVWPEGRLKVVHSQQLFTPEEGTVKWVAPGLSVGCRHALDPKAEILHPSSKGLHVWRYAIEMLWQDLDQLELVLACNEHHTQRAEQLVVGQTLQPYHTVAPWVIVEHRIANPLSPHYYFVLLQQEGQPLKGMTFHRFTRIPVWSHLYTRLGV